MRFSLIFSVFVNGHLGSFASALARRTLNDSALSTPTNALLEWTDAPARQVPQLKPAFTAKIDWDLDNNHTIATPSGTRASWWSREGYWYDPEGRRFGEILRATDDGIVPLGTNYLELLIYYVVRLDDGYWAYVKHTGGAILRQFQNGVVRIETDSPNYSWLNLIDFIAPGSFNGTEVMTVHHYFPGPNEPRQFLGPW